MSDVLARPAPIAANAPAAPELTIVVPVLNERDNVRVDVVDVVSDA